MSNALNYGPEERLRELGTSALSDGELLGLVLETGLVSPEAGLVSPEAGLARLGSLSGILSASPAALESIACLESAQRIRLLAVGELVRRVWSGPRSPLAPVRNTEEAYRLFGELALEEQEVVMLACLDARHRVQCTQRVFRGTAVASLARPREILREALRAGAVKVLVAHNHPSQEPEPSEEDLFFTVELEMAGETLGVPLVDHLIVCRGGRYFSFAEAKLLGTGPKANRPRSRPRGSGWRFAARVSKPSSQSPDDPARSG